MATKPGNTPVRYVADIEVGPIAHEEPRARCKHGDGPCDKCGTATHEPQGRGVGASRGRVGAPGHHAGVEAGRDEGVPGRAQGSGGRVAARAAGEGGTLTDTLDPREALALQALAEEAHAFGLRYRPRKAGANVPASYARALSGLVNAARLFAARSDAAWAAEVAELQDQLAKVTA